MSDFEATVPETEQAPDLRKTLAPRKIDKLDPEQRKWAANVLKALGLQSHSSQGRLLAGAIASAEMVFRSGSEDEQQQARGLRQQVIGAGKPPWDTETAMLVGSAKVQLDLLSIPETERQLRPLGGGGGINAAFWLDRQDPDGRSRHSFLCKPATLNSPVGVPSGGPRGGEVAREALSGRAASWLAGTTGIDIGMPETHVVKLPPGLMGRQGDDQLTCSVQEARPSIGSVKDATSRQLAQVNPEQVAGLAVFDMLSLNVDRHGGNLLLAEDGRSLIPIDHGESFAEPSELGLERVKNAMGGPHNALLAIPSAHAPMSKEMVKSLKSLDPKAYAKTIAGDRTLIGKQHPDMADMVSDGAVETARRAARFVQLVAKTAPDMSPASMQIAMANAAAELFGPDVDEPAFEQNARAVIERYRSQGASIKHVCTSPDPEFAKLVKKASDLGWQVAGRGGSPEGEMLTDPVVLLAIVKDRIEAPNRLADQVLRAQEIAQGQPISPDAALETVLQNRRDTLNEALQLVPQNSLTGYARRIQAALRPEYDLDKKCGYLAGILNEALRDGVVAQGQRLDQLAQQAPLDAITEDGLIDPKYRDYADARTALGNGNSIVAKELIDAVEQVVGDGSLVNRACATMIQRLRRFADTAQFQTTDQDLVAGVQAADNGDPVVANVRLDRLKRKASTSRHLSAVVNKMRTQLQEMTRDYIIDPNNRFVVAAGQALDGRRLEDAYQNLEYAMNSALSGLPSAARMRQLAQHMDVPEEDLDLTAAVQAAERNDEPAARDPWRSLMQRIQRGEVGAQAGQNAMDRIDDLNRRFIIPANHPWMARAMSSLQSNDVAAAVYHIEQLEKQAANAMFPPNRG